MSCQRECHIVEIEAGSWYLVLEREDTPGNAWNVLDQNYAECFGPFASAGLVEDELLRFHSNPGGFCEMPFSPYNKLNYVGLLEDVQPPRGKI